MSEQRSGKLEEARNTLPEELWPAFDELVSHYRYIATSRYGSPFVSYIVLADLIRSGWRCSAEPLGPPPA
ncbi:hypothetical protein JXD38_08505 [candidate division WOR-3 bacterium]|nr:hypothetical protein [candidate division WOR-3 bacterium]